MSYDCKFSFRINLGPCFCSFSKTLLNTYSMQGLWFSSVVKTKRGKTQTLQVSQHPSQIPSFCKVSLLLPELPHTVYHIHFVCNLIPFFSKFLSFVSKQDYLDKFSSTHSSSSLKDIFIVNGHLPWH